MTNGAMLGELCMTDSTCAVVVGHFSVDGCIKSEHFKFSPADNRHNFVIVDGRAGIAQYLVCNFCSTTILDLGFCAGITHYYMHYVDCNKPFQA